MSLPGNGLNLSQGNIAVKDVSGDNTAGTDLTLHAGRSTGNGTAGKIVFKTGRSFKKFTKGSAHGASAALVAFFDSANQAELKSGTAVALSGGDSLGSITEIAAGTMLMLVTASGHEIVVKTQASAISTGASSISFVSDSDALSEYPAVSTSHQVTSVFEVTTNTLTAGNVNENHAVAMEIDENKKVKIYGDLEVDGVTTQVDSVIHTVVDPLMVLGKDNQSQMDLGLVLIRSGSSANSVMVWDESEDEFVFGTSTEDGTSYGNASSITPADTRVGKLFVGTSTTEHIDDDGSNGLTVSAGAGIILDATTDIELNADGGDVLFKDGSSSKLNVKMDTSNQVRIQNGTDGDDILFEVDAGSTEVFRLDDSAGSLLMAGTKKIEFTDGSAFIHHDGTDLKLSDDADINLVAGVDILLDAAGSVILDSDAAAGTLFKDGGASYMSVASGSAGPVIKPAQADGDIVFAEDGGTEVFRLDNSAESLLMAGTKKIEFADDGNYLHQRASDVVELLSPTVEIDGATAIKLQSDAITSGRGAGDVVMTFDGSAADGVMTWKDDEDYFQFSDDVFMAASEKVYLGDTGEMIYGDGTSMHFSSSLDVNFSLDSGDFDVDAGTLTIDTTGVMAINSAGGASNISHTATANGDFTISQDASVDASLILSSAGTGADALQISTSAGGMDISVVGAAAGEDLDISCNQEINVTSTSNAEGAIYLRANGGTDETIRIHADQGTGVNAKGGSTDASINLVSDAGGIGLYSALDGDNAISLEANGGTDETIQIRSNQGTGVATADIANAVNASIAVVSDVGGIALASGLNADRAIYISADAGTDETIEIHSNQGTGTDSIKVHSDAGGLTLQGSAATSGDSDRGVAAKNINVQGCILPTVNNQYNLGSDSARFLNVFTGDLDLTNDRGSWTLIEEDSFISFRNNKTGKRFKMIMEDITGTGTYGPGNDGRM